MIEFKQLFLNMLLDGKSRKSILTTLRRRGATPGQILFLARDSDVKDAADCAWSLQVLLLAPRALRKVADTMDATQSEDLALRAAKEILAHARQVAKQEIDRYRMDPSRNPRPPLPTPEGGGLKELVNRAKQVAQKGISSSEKSPGDDDAEFEGDASAGGES
jgi:hypothetical protein